MLLTDEFHDCCHKDRSVAVVHSPAFNFDVRDPHELRLRVDEYKGVRVRRFYSLGCYDLDPQMNPIIVETIMVKNPVNHYSLAMSSLINMNDLVPVILDIGGSPLDFVIDIAAALQRDRFVFSLEIS
ncbi:hypothetical protein [Paenibacillus sp. FSL H8-237]|uniref:hypothetical protein n=1 Tax=Paenibacillus sp. FSL H8-237 TaxID=1227350 RepID=UPI00138DE3CF|nr:hypothetical protein [Paenibacillus sp. FSL H8-237]